MTLHTDHETGTDLKSLQDSRNAESLVASHSSPLQVSRVEAVQLLQVWNLLQKYQKAVVCKPFKTTWTGKHLRMRQCSTQKVQYGPPPPSRFLWMFIDGAGLHVNGHWYWSYLMACTPTSDGHTSPLLWPHASTSSRLLEAFWRDIPCTWCLS